MEKNAAVRAMLYRAALPAGCLLLIAYFAFHAVGGPTGVLAWKGYREQHASLSRELVASAEAKATLEREVKSLDPRKVDPDLADELVRKNLNVVKSDEVIVPLDQK